MRRGRDDGMGPLCKIWSYSRIGDSLQYAQILLPTAPFTMIRCNDYRFISAPHSKYAVYYSVAAAQIIMCLKCNRELAVHGEHQQIKV